MNSKHDSCFFAGLINHPVNLVLERRKLLAVSTEDLLEADLENPKSFVIHNETKT